MQSVYQNYHHKQVLHFSFIDLYWLSIVVYIVEYVQSTGSHHFYAVINILIDSAHYLELAGKNNVKLSI